jgi:hypothetical protein
MLPKKKIRRVNTVSWISGNRAAELQASFENWGLAAEPAFLPLIQALHTLADRERRAEEKKVIEALAAQLKLNRRTLVEAGVVREESTLEEWAARVDRTQAPISTAEETQ